MCMASTAYFKGGKKHDSRAELAKEIVPPLFQMWGTIKSISVWGDEIQSLVQYSIKTDVEAKIIFMGPPPVPRWSQKWGALSPHTPRLCRPWPCVHPCHTSPQWCGKGVQGECGCSPNFYIGGPTNTFCSPNIYTLTIPIFNRIIKNM